MVVEVLSAVVFDNLGKIKMVGGILVGVAGDIIVGESDNLDTDFGGNIYMVEI